MVYNIASNETRWELLINANQCTTNYHACVSTCEKKHALTKTNRTQLNPQWIRKIDLIDESNDRSLSIPLMCQHCEDPPYIEIYPTNASFKRTNDMVLIDKHTCINCRYYIMAYPFNTKSFVHEKVTKQKSYSPHGKNTVESYTLCVHQINNDRTPACVESCAVDKHGALTFNDLNDSESTMSKTVHSQPHQKLRPDLKLNTNMRYRKI